MSRAALGFAGIAVAAKIGQDYRELLCQSASDFVPNDMSLWKAMKQKQRRTVTFAEGMNSGTAGLHFFNFKSWKEWFCQSISSAWTLPFRQLLPPVLEVLIGISSVSGSAMPTPPGYLQRPNAGTQQPAPLSDLQISYTSRGPVCWSGSQEPLLAPGPLRTARAGFLACSSSMEQRTLATRGEPHWS